MTENQDTQIENDFTLEAAPSEECETPETSIEDIKSKDAKLPALLAGDIKDESDPEALTLAPFAAKAYLAYALSVVKSRALPDLFDGMKPVQRRILYAMNQLRLNPTSKAVKCAHIVGEVLGKYHPHGDSAAYEALVRMAQDFSVRYPLVDGQGNFGSRDGDGPAAMRYTEARLTKISELLLSELDSEDVDFIPNYDGSHEEPTLLPARMPFVLLNGASGIAVGLATEIPTHNLTEVGEAVLKVIENPQVTLDELLSVMPGPDYPGGAQIISSAAEIHECYRTGRGSLKVRAKYHFEDLQRGQWQLVIDELPPAASAESILSEIDAITNPKPKAGKRVVNSEQLQEKASMLSILEGARNECSRENPMRLVFEPKTSKVDRDLFVNVLLTKTGLESNAPMNMVMIGIDGNPKQKGLVDILSEWVKARLSTVRRRTQVRLDKVNARLHILQGRTIAIDNIDRIIEIVRFEPDPKATLMKEFNLSDEQAEDILELRLRQLANLEFERVAEEMRRLEEEAAKLNRVLSSDAVLRNLVAKEVKEAIKLYGDARRTTIKEADKATSEIPQVVEPVTIVLSQKGYVRSRLGHGHDATLMMYKTGDGFDQAFECMTDEMLIAIGSNGRMYSIAASDLPSARGDGLPVTSFIDLESGSEIVGYIAGKGATRILLASDAGLGFECTLGDMVARNKAGKQFFRLEDGERMLAPQIIDTTTTRIACLSAEGRLLVFELSELKTLSAGGKGVILMELNPGEKLLATLPVNEEGAVISGAGRGGKDREKTLTKDDWMRHYGKRARKGRVLEIRFDAKTIAHIEKAENGEITHRAEEEQPEPTLFK